jgi:NAD(P)-dependent dehydrogenase (short-subunit alcohol dehydrogenase family)
MNKTALVTGASRGIGKAIAAHLTAAGVRVIGTYNTTRTAGDLLHLDVTRTDTYAAFTRTLSDALGGARLDYLVNNAGVASFVPYAETDEETFDRTVAVNLKAPFFLTQHLLPLLNDGGRILNLSTALTRAHVPGGSAYAATKGAVEVLTRYQAVELAARGIRVNTIMGGAIESDLGGGVMRNDQVQKLSADVIALGRIGTPDDLAAAIPAILSDSFAWATGGLIDLSGGQSL